MQVPDGAVLTYTGQWKNTFDQSADDVVSAVSDLLLGAGLAVRSSNVSQGFSVSAVVGVPQDFTATLQLQVENGLGFGDPSDVISIIRSFVNQVTGSFPTSDTIPWVQVAGGPQQSTGQPGATALAPCDKSKCGIADIFSSSSCCTLADAVSNATTTGLWGIGLIVIGILAGVILLSQHHE